MIIRRGRPGADGPGLRGIPRHWYNEGFMSEDDFDNIIEYSELCDKYSRVAVDDYDDYMEFHDELDDFEEACCSEWDSEEDFASSIRQVRNACAHGLLLYDLRLPQAIRRDPAAYNSAERNNIIGAIRVIRGQAEFTGHLLKQGESSVKNSSI